MTASIGPRNRKKFYCVGNKVLMEKSKLFTQLYNKIYHAEEKKLRYKHDNCIGIFVLQNYNSIRAKIN